MVTSKDNRADRLARDDSRRPRRLTTPRPIRPIGKPGRSGVSWWWWV